MRALGGFIVVSLSFLSYAMRQECGAVPPTGSVKARVMRLASDGPILFEGFLWSGCADSSAYPATRYRQNRRATKKRAEPTIGKSGAELS